MSDSDINLPPLDAETEALLRYERERPPVGSERAGRMWSAIAAELAVAIAPGTAQATPTPAGGSSVSGAIATTGRLALLKALPWVAVSLSIGSAAGFVAGHRLATSTSPRGARRAAPTLSEPSSATRTVTPVPLAPVPHVQAPAVPPSTSLMARPSTSHRTSIGRSTVVAADDLTVEAEIVARAESALRAGDWAAALAQSDAYSRRFPHGQLAEEAAYLGIRACEGSGDETSVQRRLSDFRRRFPQSPLGE